MTSLIDKTIVIIGAAGGLGRQHALACARAGAKLVLCDAGCATDGTGADPTPLTTVAAQVSQVSQHTPVTHHGRIEAPETVSEVLELARDRFGATHGVVFSAGLSRKRPLLRMTDEDFSTVLETQVLAAMRVTRESAQAMLKAGGGSIVLTLGASGLLGAQHEANQAAAAGAVAAFVRSAALDLRRHNVRVNALAPLARTRVNADLPVFQRASKDALTPEQVSPTVLYLLSAASSHVSGEVVGAAGARVYGIRVRDTPGHFFTGEFDAAQVADVFDDAIRP